MFALFKIKWFNYIHCDKNKVYGLIAQDIKWNIILNECLLKTDDVGIYSLNYSNISLINILGIQTLIKENNNLKIEMNEIKNIKNDFKIRLKKLTDYLNLI